MKLLQTYYTSCRIGQTGSSGFQFYSFSDGITESELDEIGKLGSYTAPYGSNPFPTEEEVINVLPVAFKYFRLSSGRVGVLQSTACTQEYTGRPGNFLTHALILEEGEFPFMPILLNRNEYFKHDLTDEQKNIQVTPSLLPLLMVDESNFSVDTGNRNNFSIQQFVKQGNNEELLSKLLDIILTGKGVQKRIVMADNKPEDVIYALSNALPFENIADFTFSTYSLYPEAQNVILSASRYEGSDFNFDDMSMKFSYYVFNNTNGKYAELEDQSELSKKVIKLLASEPQRINELYEYSSHFSGEKDIKSLGLIASIFSKDDFAAKWKQILPFVAAKAKPEYVEKFLAEYKEQINQLINTFQSENDISVFFENLLKLIHRLPNSFVWFDNLFSWYLSIIIKHFESSTESLIELNKHILNIFKGADREVFIKHFFSRDTFSCLTQQAHTELAVFNVFTLIISSTKTLLGTFNDNKLFSFEEIVKNIDEEPISRESFQVLIAEVSDEADLLLSAIFSIREANSLVKRLIRELADEKNVVSFHKIIAKGILDNPAMADEIREEAISQLEKKALTHTPTNEELRLYTQIKKWINDTEYPAISLVLSEKNVPALIEQISTFKDAKKMSVFLEWKSGEIFPSLKQPEDWKNFYSLSKHIELDTLNICAEKYFKQAKETKSLVALITFSHTKNNRQMDDMLRKILTTMNRSAYNALKRDMEQCPNKVCDYFASLDKGSFFKRLFNLKF
ncbi:MAG: hypothetical protein LBI15_02860 [Dysgonamonadaceae bacterium]|jgi:hypothetical protein|nr:hypothetical protein [Dysgonamonadaceae bacterium]